MGLLINELSKKKNIFLKVCFTGQHDKMINEFAQLFNFKVNKNFKVMNKNDLVDFSAKLSIEINKYIKKIKKNIFHFSNFLIWVKSLILKYCFIKNKHVITIKIFKAADPMIKNIGNREIKIVEGCIFL